MITIKNALTLLTILRGNARPLMFEIIFGNEELNGRKIWELHYDKFLSLNSDVIAFWNYLDESYKQVFLEYLEKIADDKNVLRR